MLLRNKCLPFALGTVNVLLTTPMWVVNTRLKLQGAKFRNEDLHQTHYKGIFGQSKEHVTALSLITAPLRYSQSLNAQSEK